MFLPAVIRIGRNANSQFSLSPPCASEALFEEANSMLSNDPGDKMGSTVFFLLPLPMYINLNCVISQS